MLEVKEYDNSDLKAIFGKNKKGIDFFDIWLRKYPILESNEVSKWIGSKVRQFAQKGKEAENFDLVNYVSALQVYCNAFEKAPSELLQENVDTRNNRLLTYLNHLISEGKNEVTVKNAYQSRIKSFYSARGSPISKGVGLDTEQNGVNKNEIDLSKDKLQAILTQLNNSEYKIIAKIQALLGLRIGDALKELTATKKNSKEAKYNIELYKQHYVIKDFETQKEKVKIRNMFFPKELSKLIQTTYQIKDLTKLDLTTIFKTSKRKYYLTDDDILRLTKSITSDDDIEKLTDDDIDKFKNGEIKLYFNNKEVIREKKGRKNIYYTIIGNNIIRSTEYSRKLRQIAKELFPSENMKTHSLRKYFYTRLGYVNLSDMSKELINETIGSEVEEKFKEHLMGHKLHYSSTVYSKITSNRETFYNLWIPLEKSLCIDCEIVNTTDKDVLKVKEENVKLKEQIDTLLKDGLQMKRLLLDMFVKLEDIDDLDDLIDSKYTNYVEAGKTDAENKAIMEQKNKNIQYLLQIKRDLE